MGIQSARTRRRARRRAALVITLSSLLLTTNLAGVAWAKEGVGLDQCGNGKTGLPPESCTGSNWQTGNLNKNNSQYAEGDGVAFRSVFTGLEANTTYVYTIGWDTVQSDNIAYDYLVSWDHTETGDPASDTAYAGTPADSSIAIPADPRISNEGIVAAAGDIEAWGVTLNGIGNYQYESGTATDPLPLGTMQTSADITFTTGTETTAVVAWGGHIATVAEWTPERTTAVIDINGSPYHMRAVGLLNETDDTDINLGNMDRSLSAAAIELAAELSITKTASVSQVAPGGSFSYTITVTNNGTGEATNVSVTDSVDSAFSVTGVTPSQGSCDAPSNSVSCDLGSLAVDASATVTVTVDVPADPDSCTTVGNTAGVSADDIDAIESNNVDVTITPCVPDLSLAKSNDTGGVAGPGETFTWTLTVTNSASATATATDVQVTDTIPAGLTVTDVTADAGVDCSASSGSSIDCTIATLAADTSVDIDVAIEVPDSDSCGSYPNTGTLTDNAQTVDTDQDTVVVSGCSATITIDKANNTGSSAEPGDTFEWTLTVTNDAQASGTAENLQVTDTIPAGLTVESVVGDAGTDCSASSGSNVDCTIASLEPGALMVITITVSVPDADSCGQYQNTGEVSDGNSTLDSDLDTVEVRGCSPDLSITKSNDTDDAAGPGDIFTWTLTVANDAAATGTATNVTVTDAVPAGLTVSDITPDAGVNCGASSGNNVNCTVASLAPGASADIDVEVAVPGADSCGAYLNTGEIDLGEDTIDADEDTVTVAGCDSDVAITKTASADEVGLDGQVAYTLTATNDAQATQTATDVMIVDEVPDPFVVTDVASEDADCSGSAGNNVLCVVGDLDPGQSAVVTITASAPDDGPVCHVWSNTAEVRLGQLLVDEDTADVAITGCAPAIEVVKTADIDEEDGVKTAVYDPGDEDDETVSYTYEITNVGTVTLTDVTLTDDILGTLLTADDNVTLAPGESTTATATHVLTEADADSGQVVNVAVTTGVDPEQDEVSDTDDEIVFVEALGGGVLLAATGGEVIPLFGISNVLIALGAAVTRLVPRTGQGGPTSGGPRSRAPLSRYTTPTRRRRRSNC